MKASKQLIKIVDIDGNQSVSADELHRFLEVKTDFTNWCKRMFEYGFVEGFDYNLVYAKNGINPKGGRPSIDYTLTLDCAKEIAMVQRTEKGKQARQYFIAVEKEYRAQQSGQPVSKDMIQQCRDYEYKVAELQEQLAYAKKRFGDMAQTVKLMNEVAMTMGDIYEDKGASKTKALSEEQRKADALQLTSLKQKVAALEKEVQKEKKKWDNAALSFDLSNWKRLFNITKNLDKYMRIGDSSKIKKVENELLCFLPQICTINNARTQSRIEAQQKAIALENSIIPPHQEEDYLTILEYYERAGKSFALTLPQTEQAREKLRKSSKVLGYALISGTQGAMYHRSVLQVCLGF